MQQPGKRGVDRRTLLRRVGAGGALSLAPVGVVGAKGVDEFSKSRCRSDRVTAHSPDGTAVEASSPRACEIPTDLPGHEPCVRVDSEGTVYYSVVDEPVSIARSTDDGVSWETMELPADYDTSGLDLEGGLVPGGTTGDGTGNESADGSMDLSREYRRKGTSYLHLDEDTDRLFYGSVGTGPILFSDDGGESWTAGTIPEDVTTHDWPKFFTGPPVDSDTGDYPNVVYYLDFTGERDQTSLFKSTDGGRSYEEVSVVGENGDCTTETNDREHIIHGAGSVDSDGTVYVPLYACGDMAVAVSHDEGETWERRRVDGATYPDAAEKIEEWTDLSYLFRDPSGFNALQGFEVVVLSQVLDVDDEGGLYVVWIDQSDVTLRVAYSEDGGRSWSEPLSVTPAGVDRAILPGLAVAEPGRLGLSYVGSEDGDTWHAYLAESPDVRESEPTVFTGQLTDADAPVTRYGCCWNGSDPSGLFEQTTVDFGPDGSIWGSFVRDNGDDTWEGLVGRLVDDDTGHESGRTGWTADGGTDWWQERVGNRTDGRGLFGGGWWR